MSNELLGNIIYFMVMFSWMVYLSQELFITGASALNRVVSNNEQERKQVQVTAGLHFDGIEVWLLAALTMLLAAFPEVFALQFEHLYIPLFLLLYALIARGVSIEVIYKLDNETWVKSMVWAWTISSILIMFVLGVYMSNTFLGFPLVDGEMTQSFASIFNVTGISGGLFFVTLSLVAGSGWLYLTTEGHLHEKALKFIKKAGIIYTVPVFLMLTLFGLNNVNTSFINGELYQNYPVLFVIPGLLVISVILLLLAGHKQKGKQTFIYGVSTMALFIITGYVGMFPYTMISKGSFENSLSISDTMSGSDSLLVVFIAVCIFYPIVFLYQGWKYIKFAKTKIKLNDE